MPVTGGSRRGTTKSWATKVKTGCLTCKRRRIKCDETRPSCRRCATHNVECEGYPDLSYRPPGTSATPSASSSLVIYTPETSSSASLRDTDPQDLEASRGDTENPTFITRESQLTTRSYNQSNHPNRAMYTYFTPASINAWTEAFSPYTTAEQRLAIAAWTELAPSMSRSQDGLDYWNIAVPSISWRHSAVRNALMATSTIFHSLRRKDTSAEYAVAEVRAVGYANQCIRELISTRAAPEAVIACATLFWIFEMMSGNWTNSLTHLAAGFRISRSTISDTVSEPHVPEYIMSFVGNLPATINPENIVSMSEQDQVSQSDARHRFARPIMRDALDRLKAFQESLEASHLPQRELATRIIIRSMGELDKMYQRWPIRSDLDHESPEVPQIVTKYSPFIGVLEDARRILQDNDFTHIETFVTPFRSCVDHFIWLGACLHLHHRQQLIEAWTVVRERHGFDEAFIYGYPD